MSLAHCFQLWYARPSQNLANKQGVLKQYFFRFTHLPSAAAIF